MILSLKKEGRTIIITSHHQEDIDILCDKVYEMDAGKITTKGYTDIKQSKKLAEFLPIESADMCYIQDLLAGGKYGDYIIVTSF